MNKNPSRQWTSELTDYLVTSDKISFALDLLTDGPGENKGGKGRLRISRNDDDKTVVSRFLFELQSDAERVLKKKGYPTDIKDLINCQYDMMDREAAHAWTTLLYISSLKDAFENNDAARIFLAISHSKWVTQL